MITALAKSIVRFTLAAIALAGGLVPYAVSAEPPQVLFLSGVTVAERESCSVIRIGFNSRLQYKSHLPASSGDEVRIDLLPVDNAAANRAVVVNQESLHAPANDRASVHAIEFSVDAQGAALTLYFKHNVAYKIAPGPDFKSLLIAVAGSEPSPTCLPQFNEKVEATPPGADPGDLDRQMSDSRAALATSDWDRALDLLSKVRASGGQRYTQEADELIGVAREGKGQTVEARAAYQEYVERYPQGSGADRVRARVAALDVAAAGGAGSLAVTSAKLPQTMPKGGEDGLADDGASRVLADKGRGLIDEKTDPDAWTITHNGSVSLYYNHNQGGRDFFVPPRLQLGWDKENIYQVYQNSILGTLDYDARFDNATFAGRFHASGAQDNRYVGGQNDEGSISALYLDGRVKDSGVSGRIGRQTRYGSGVLGRFDGALTSYQFSKSVTLHAVAGSPVERSRDQPFVNDSYFYGFSADFDNWHKNIDTSVFFIDQRTQGMIDRQGAGFEARIIADSASAFGSIDYDLHYGEVNYAILSGTYGLPDTSIAGFSLDYRRAPLIFTSNALQGQGVATLSDLLKIYTRDDIERLSLDRSAESVTAGVNYSYPITENLQFNGDVTATYVSKTKESGGVAAYPSTGTDIYLLGQLIGTNVVAEGDSVIGGLHYADTQSSYRYLIEGSMRYPLSKDWRITPILRLGYAEFKDDGRGEYQILPSVRTSYYFSNDLSLEVELGKKWLERETLHGTESETELTVLTGIRYDFSSDK